MDTTKITIIKDTIISSTNKISEHVTVETIEYREQDTKTNWCDCQLLQHLIWPTTILLILLLFYGKIKGLIEHIVKRVSDGAGLEFGPGGVKISEGEKRVPYDKNDTVGDSFDTKFPLENETAKKIMSTFWIHQNEYDPKYNIRWTFKIGSNPDYDTTINKLHWLGLVAYDPASTQYFLTDYGLHYCNKNKDSLGNFSYFK
jgi:hypothetical protein